MTRSLFSLWLCLAGILLVSGASYAEQIYLDAYFNDKAIDEPIGQNGPEFGEPVEVEQVTAIVRQGPMDSPALEIQDIQLYGGSATFTFLEGAEITTGILYIAADLWFDTLADADSCAITVRETDSNQKPFADLIFRTDGSIKLDYGEGLSLGNIGQLVAGRVFRVILEFDMDAGTFDVWLDGVLAADDVAHGITDRGIGKVRFGVLFDANTVGRFFVDNIKVTDFFEQVPAEKATWGRIRNAFK